MKTLKEKTTDKEREIAVLEQRLALCEMCRNLSTADGVAALEEEIFAKSVFQVKRRGLTYRFEVKLALVGRSARASLDAFFQQEMNPEMWQGFITTWRLKPSDASVGAEDAFDGCSPLLSTVLRELVANYEAAGFLDEDDESEETSLQKAQDRQESFEKSCKVGATSGVEAST